MAWIDRAAKLKKANTAVTIAPIVANRAVRALNINVDKRDETLFLLPFSVRRVSVVLFLPFLYKKNLNTKNTAYIAVKKEPSVANPIIHVLCSCIKVLL